MKTLSLGAVAALVGASLAGCASPHYPLSEGGERGPAPLTEQRPQYPIEAARAAPAPAPVAAQTAPKDDDAPVTTPTAQPPATVESQPLPPPSQSSASYAGGARLQYAAYRTEDDTTTAPAASPASTPVTTPPPAPTPAANAPALTPQMVVHDQSATPPITPVSPRHDTATAPAPFVTPVTAATRRTGTLPRPDTTTVAVASSEPITPATDAPGMSITGAVVHASGVFENYEVQKGDHVDALARAFNTSRSILVDENHLKSPFTLRNGQIIKVPVAKAYVVKSGDSLSGVARRFSVSLNELADLNHVSARVELRAGQQIGLPSSMRDRGPLPAEATYAQTSTPRSYSYTPAERGRIVEVTPSSQAPYLSGRPLTPPAEATPSMSDADAARAAKGRFIWPVRGDIISHFGPMGVGQRNDGVDIKAAQDASVKAAADGQVLYAGNQVKGYGNVVLVQHADGWVTVYAHLDKIEVHTQDQVSQGQELGLVGANDGGETSLHFEIRYHPAPGVKTQALDPVLLLPVG